MYVDMSKLRESKSKFQIYTAPNAYAMLLCSSHVTNAKCQPRGNRVTKHCALAMAIIRPSKRPPPETQP